MLDERLIFAKTSKGIAEVASRSGDVSLAARRVLIMIDGKRSVAELAPFARPGEIGTIVEQLEAQGFVYAAQAWPPPPPTPPAPVAPNPPAADADEAIMASFETIKKRAVRELTDRLGPDAEVIAMRIEQTRTPDDLRARLHEAERLVAGFLGEEQAHDFLRALRRR